LREIHDATHPARLSPIAPSEHTPAAGSGEGAAQLWAALAAEADDEEA